MSVRRWAVVSIVASVVIMFCAGVVSLGGWTGWPLVPIVLCVAVTTAGAVATRRRGLVIAFLVVWAVLACPLPITASDGGFARVAPGTLRANGLQRVTRGHLTVDVGPVPAGVLWLRRAARISLGDTSPGPDADLVGYTAGWLPYPHLQRTVVHTLGGNDPEDWAAEEEIQLRRDGDRTIVVGHRDRSDGTRVPELRPIGITVSRSTTTWVGWILIAAAWALSSPALGDSRTPPAAAEA